MMILILAVFLLLQHLVHLVEQQQLKRITTIVVQNLLLVMKYSVFLQTWSIKQNLLQLSLIAILMIFSKYIRNLVRKNFLIH